MSARLQPVVMKVHSVKERRTPGRRTKTMRKYAQEDNGLLLHCLAQMLDDESIIVTWPRAKIRPFFQIHIAFFVSLCLSLLSANLLHQNDLIKILDFESVIVECASSSVMRISL